MTNKSESTVREVMPKTLQAVSLENETFELCENRAQHPLPPKPTSFSFSVHQQFT